MACLQAVSVVLLRSVHIPIALRTEAQYVYPHSQIVPSGVPVGFGGGGAGAGLDGGTGAGEGGGPGAGSEVGGGGAG
jgi:hypothetical protein